MLTGGSVALVLYLALHQLGLRGGWAYVPAVAIAITVAQTLFGSKKNPDG